MLILGLWLAKPFYWSEDMGEDDLTGKTGLDSVSIPEHCAEYESDVCALFDCMVDYCWCLESPDAVLVEGSGFVTSEAEARYAVEDYLESQGGLTVKSAVKLNEAFYNVFAEDAEGNEEVFTVAADGSIIKTICGV